MTPLDLSSQRVVSARDVEAAVKQGKRELIVRNGGVITPSARDLARQHGVLLRGQDAALPGGDAPPRGARRSPERGFFSPAAEAIKAEIARVGLKLWQRQYVDGNGGNISCRLSDNTVICTPTLVSKADLRPEDLCLVDLEGNQLVGTRPRTSEILMHLEIYKSVREAKAVVHCHPPHATAYAITGRVPPTCVIPEYEVFVGGVALSPYETPGTREFAETVLPYVRHHNTVLLANHGIVCWADTVTHAEWYAEVVDTYCWTLMLAAQLGAPITHIPRDKATDLLAIKQRLGLPDARFDQNPTECRLCDLPELPGAIAVDPPQPPAPASASNADVESLVQAVTDAVMETLAQSSK